MGMAIEKIITNEKGIVADFQNAINTHMTSEGLSVEELCCDDTEVIEEQLARWQKIADYHDTIVTCLEKYQKIERIIEVWHQDIYAKDFECIAEVAEVVEDGNDNN
jgi:hypothetical protein